MVSKKAKTPISVLRALQPFVDQVTEYYETVDSDYVLRIIHRDPSTNYFFEIVSFDTSGGKLRFTIKVNPYTDNSVTPQQVNVFSHDLPTHFQSWVKRIKEFHQLRSPYKDKFVEDFKNEFFEEFSDLLKNPQIENGSKPFATSNVLLLDKYFENLSREVKSHDPKGENIEVAEILEDITDLRNNLMYKSSQWVLEKGCWIWAKAARLSTKILNDVVGDEYKVVRKELIDQLWEGVKQLPSHLN